jgi:hypothetical protein
MAHAPLDPTTLTVWLAAMAIAAPVVLLLVAYDVRWIWLSVRAGVAPPWGAFVRLGAAALCHGGAALLASYGAVWPRETLVWWMHMTLDPGLTLYALGLWELGQRVGRQRPAA